MFQNVLRDDDHLSNSLNCFGSFVVLLFLTFISVLLHASLLFVLSLIFGLSPIHISTAHLKMAYLQAFCHCSSVLYRMLLRFSTSATNSKVELMQIRYHLHENCIAGLITVKHP